MFSNEVNKCLLEKKPYCETEQLKKCSGQKVILPVMESYNHRLRGGEWEELKIKIGDLYLLPTARRWTESRFWNRRNYSARCFALIPLQNDSERILKLLDDKVFLVRSIAAVAAVQLEERRMIYKILQHMSVVAGYANSFYNDILLQGSDKVFRSTAEIALSEKDPQMHIACLKVLGCRTVNYPLPFLKEDLNSDNIAIRRAAIKVVAMNPQMDAEEILWKYLKDPSEDVRIEAISGMQFFVNDNTIAKLSEALKDESWSVRYQAANTLKKMGDKGLLALNQQDPRNSRQAYDVAHYALQFNR